MQIKEITKLPGAYLIRDPRAVDGDTIEAIVCLPFGTMVQKRIRLKGWWAPEMTGANSANGILAQGKLQSFLRSHDLAIISRGHRQDKYGRIIADLWALGHVISPGEVLGIFALSEAAHKAEHDALKKLRSGFFDGGFDSDKTGPRFPDIVDTRPDYVTGRPPAQCGPSPGSKPGMPPLGQAS